MNRGRHPIIWALVLGLKNCINLLFINKYADAGDILDQKIVRISYEDNAFTLYQKLTRTAIKQINSFLPNLQNNTYIKKSQDEKKANTWRRRTKVDGFIDWRMDSENIRNLIRGLTKPYCGLPSYIKVRNIKFGKLKLLFIYLKILNLGKL